MDQVECSHIWTDPSKLDALDDPDSQEYQRAFRREVDERKAKTLKTAGTSKRFATMKLGRVATALYEALSKFDVHGGTSARFFAYSTETTPFTCSFSMRPVPASGRVVQHVKLLTDGYKTVCGEAIALGTDHAERSDELMAAAEAYMLLASVTGEPSPELQERVAELLGRLGTGESEVQRGKPGADSEPTF
jgi:hypothetical protein